MEAMTFAWNLIMKDFAGTSLPIAVAIFVVFLPVGIVSSLLQFILRLALDYVDASFIGIFSALLYAVLGGLGLFVNSYVAGGVVEFALKKARGQPASFGDVFGGGKYFGKMLIGMLGFAVVYGIGIALCVVPGVIVLFGLWPFAFILVDQNLSGIDALKKAWAMTNGHKMSIFIFWLLCVVAVIAGEIACFLPVLLVSYPLIILATAHMYMTLNGETPRLPQ
jgi:uncharacterized membrane protein